MINIYILTFLREEERKPEYFTSIIAIFERYDSNTLKVKYSSMSNYNFGKGDIYNNKTIQIERVIANSREDIIKEKDMR